MSKALMRAQAIWSGIDAQPRSERPIGDLPVNTVVIDGAITVVYTPQDQGRLVVSGSEMHCVNDVSTRIDGQVLYVSRVDSPRPRVNRKGWGRLVDLLQIAFGFRQDADRQAYPPVYVGLTQRFAPNVVHNGSGDVHLASLEQHNVDVEIAGLASVEVSGRVDFVQVVISGSGSFKGKHLKSNDASLVIAGSGAIKVEATSKVRSKISGSGSIIVLGSPPDRTKSVSGSGHVSYV